MRCYFFGYSSGKYLRWLNALAARYDCTTHTYLLMVNHIHRAKSQTLTPLESFLLISSVSLNNERVFSFTSGNYIAFLVPAPE